MNGGNFIRNLKKSNKRTKINWWKKTKMLPIKITRKLHFSHLRDACSCRGSLLESWIYNTRKKDKLCRELCPRNIPIKVGFNGPSGYYADKVMTIPNMTYWVRHAGEKN